MAQKLGQKGCLHADLEIAQGQALAFEIEHIDDEGHPIDHSGDRAWCRLQRTGHADAVWDSYIDMDDAADGIVRVSVPGSVTAAMDAGEWVWDMFVEDVRLAYGKAQVVDTYAKD